MTPKLGEILTSKGFCTEKQLQDALNSPDSRGGRLGAVLVKQGILSQAQLGEALAEQFKVPFKGIEPQEIHLQAVRLVPENLARDRQIAPLGVKAGVLTLAMVAPDDMEAISEVELISGYHVEPVVSMAADIKSLLDRAFDERNVARQTVVDIKLAEMRERKLRSDDPAVAEVAVDDESPVVKLVRSILMGAVNAKASDIHMEPHKPQMRVRFRVDGQMQSVMTIPPEAEDAVVGRIKVMATMDTTEKRRPQDGNLTIEEKGMRASFRVSCIPVVGGEKVVMRVIDEGDKVFTFDALGMPAKQVETVKTLIDKPHGMIVVTGPTGSGKTTTMYTMLMNIDANENNISTVEDPVEFQLHGVNQVHANPEHGMGFAHALKYLMRQDPDVILVGEIRDVETATAAVQAALTGHLLISTLHTNDAVGAVQRLNDLGMDRFKIAGSLLAALAQRLLRRICNHCKEPCETNEKMLSMLLEGREKLINIPANTQFYHGRGCHKCLGSGYSGRVPVYEIMNVTPVLEKAIESGEPNSALRVIALNDGMVELAVGGLERAMLGQTTIEEVYYKLSV
jgi:type IV pilus assembly protein PilB